MPLPTAHVTPQDVPLMVSSALATAERRITPSWTISQLKAKLEPVTGIPPASQQLVLRLPGQQPDVTVEAEHEDSVQIGRWPLSREAEINVTSTDPSIQTSIPSAASVPKYVMPEETYSTLPDSVLAYKKSHKIGRFDPSAAEKQEEKLGEMWAEIEEKGIKVSARCIVAPGGRRGNVRFVGLIPEIPAIGPWIGVELDEPVGKNDGSVAKKRYFECKEKRGVFVRAEKLEIADVGVELEEEGSEMEEI